MAETSQEARAWQRLAVESVACQFSNAEQKPLAVLNDINITVEANEFVSIVGPSGCGKSTLFNVIAGFVSPTGGRVLLDGNDITGESGHVGYMMQKDYLLPWRTVLANVMLGPELSGEAGRKTIERVIPLMRRFGLEGFEHFYPSALSGGMRQRAALMRTFLYDRDVLLLDEPFGALDALTRASMHEWLLEVVETEFQNCAVLFITHDPEEAVFLSDRVYVLTARPARVKGIIEVNIPRPRRHDVITTEEFTRKKADVLRLVRGAMAPEDPLLQPRR